MKKVMLFMLCLMASTWAFAQKDLNSSQLKLRTEIFNFLKEEGFMPEIDSDGDIKFKRQGGTYFIMIDDANNSPMYLDFAEYISAPEKYSETVLKLASERLTNRYKAIKCNYVASSKTLRVAAEMFLRSAEPFKEVFYKLASIMDSLEDEIINTCDEFASLSSSGNNVIPLSINKLEIGNVFKDGTVETKYGEPLYEDNTMYLKPRITYTGNRSGNIILKVKFFTAEGALSTSSNSPTGFSYEKSVSLEKGSGKTIELSGWGGEDKGHWKAGNYRIEVWYENTCLKNQGFEVVEKIDSSKQLYLDVLVATMKEELGGLPSTISVGKFNMEITEMEAVSKLDKVITVFRMPKSKSSISSSEKEQTLTYCENFCFGVNMEWKKLQSDLKELGLENLQMVYRLEDIYGAYIAGEKK